MSWEVRFETSNCTPFWGSLCFILWCEEDVSPQFYVSFTMPACLHSFWVLSIWILSLDKTFFVKVSLILVFNYSISKIINTLSIFIYLIILTKSFYITSIALLAQLIKIILITTIMILVLFCKINQWPPQC